jgi:hypothetical protein
MKKVTKMVLGTLLMLCSFNFTCKKDNNVIKIFDFDSKLWKEDSLACNGVRAEMAKIVIANEHILYGKSQKEIQMILGYPNVVYGSSYRYFIEKGIQCSEYVTKKGYDSLETTSIIINFDKYNNVQKHE